MHVHESEGVRSMLHSLMKKHLIPAASGVVRSDSERADRRPSAEQGTDSSHPGHRLHS